MEKEGERNICKGMGEGMGEGGKEGKRGKKAQGHEKRVEGKRGNPKEEEGWGRGPLKGEGGPLRGKGALERKGI